MQRYNLFLNRTLLLINFKIIPLRLPGQPGLFDHLSLDEKHTLYERTTELFSDNKRQLFDRLAPLRTRHLCVVLEDIYQSLNASAVLRSCDCFGVQDVHVKV